MIEFVLAFLIMVTIVIAMAVGVLHGRAPIAGTCGGLNNLAGGGACELCGGDTSKCESNDLAPAPARGSFFDAS
tara:strand:+ start:44167 stop:44388 length:222 start_codon:yes stop_codon:yes gene_type:complete